jgi:RNA polymerase sporulation-specific sigma factor
LDQIKTDNGQDAAYFDKLSLKEVMSRLPTRERTVICLRFFEDKTQAEIASLIGLSQVQVSRIEKNALKLIKIAMQVS